MIELTKTTQVVGDVPVAHWDVVTEVLRALQEDLRIESQERKEGLFQACLNEDRSLAELAFVAAKAQVLEDLVSSIRDILKYQQPKENQPK